MARRTETSLPARRVTKNTSPAMPAACTRLKSSSIPASVKKIARMAGSKFENSASTSFSRSGVRFVCTRPRKRHESSGEMPK